MGSLVTSKVNQVSVQAGKRTRHHRAGFHGVCPTDHCHGELGAFPRTFIRALRSEKKRFGIHSSGISGTYSFVPFKECVRDAVCPVERGVPRRSGMTPVWIEKDV